MNGTPPDPTSTASELQRLIGEEGFAVLAVTADLDDAGWFTVYVQGPIGSSSRETLLGSLSTVPGVREVRFSELTSSILRVYREPDGVA